MPVPQRSTWHSVVTVGMGLKVSMLQLDVYDIHIERRAGCSLP